MKLNEISVGDVGYVVEILGEKSITRRLLDIGFVPETKVECVLQSLKKDIKAYKIRGTLIAIREEDASNIIIFRK